MRPSAITVALVLTLCTTGTNGQSKNPFGLHDFDKKPPGTGNLVIAPRQSVTFKYRFYLHEGDEKQAKVAERYQAYVAEAK